MAQWLWRLQLDTLSLSPAVAGFFSSPFSLSRLNSKETSIIRIYVIIFVIIVDLFTVMDIFRT